MKNKTWYSLLRRIRLGRPALLAIALALSAIIAVSAMRLDLSPSNSLTEPQPAGKSQGVSAVINDPTITVNTLDNELNTDGDCSLREAITAANANRAIDGCTADKFDTIDFSATIDFSVPRTINVTGGTFVIRDPLTILGPGARNLTVNGNGGRVFMVNAGKTFTLQGVTITNGGSGGARNIGNVGGFGGGAIWNDRGTVSVNNVTFLANCSCGNGGNGNGGAIANGGTLRVLNSTFKDNSSLKGGGAIFNFAGYDLDNTNIVYNGSAVIINSTFSGNETRGAKPRHGGAILNWGQDGITATLRVMSSTIAYNHAGLIGGGIDSNGEGDVVLRNTIVANNTAVQNGPNCRIARRLYDEGGNLDNGTSCLFTNPTSKNNANAYLDDQLRNNGGQTDTIALLKPPLPQISDAIDKGVPRTGADCTDDRTPPQPLKYDQRGLPFPRRVDGNGDGVATCDIGAYEFGPALTTSAVTGVYVGENIHDTATIKDLVNPDGTGTITFKLYSDAACTTQVFTYTTPGIPADGSYPSGDYTTTAAGSFYWIASFSGDSHNKPVETLCGDPGETSIVNIHPIPSITTSAVTGVYVGEKIHDTATIKDLVNPDGTGTITFKLYSDAACTIQVFTNPVGSVDHNGDYPSGDYTTTAASSFYWIASFSGDSHNKPVETLCGDPNEISVVNKVTPSISTSAVTPVFVGQKIHDTATISGLVNPDGTGTITFKLYSDAACTTQVFTYTTPGISANGNYISGDYAPAVGGSYYWIASFSSDSNNNSATTICGDPGETSIVNVSPVSITTAPNPPSGTVGDTLNDSATLTGGFNPTGNISFKLYAPSDPTCSGTPAFTNVVPVNGEGTYPTSGGFVSNATGVWRWMATYSDGNNNPVISSRCDDEHVTIEKATPFITTTPDPSSGTVGDILNDSATLTGGFNPTGTITFSLYDPNDPTCSGTPAFTDVVSVNGNGAYPTSSGFISNTGGVWQWTAAYSGDDNNEAASSTCADEPVTINPGSPIKVTGGGQIPVPNPNSKGKATFGFNADQTEAGSTAATGHFNYVNHETGLHINGSVNEIQIIATNPDGSPKTVQFSGTCDGNGPVCTFIVTVEDHGEPGTSDEFGITVTGDVSESQSQRVISQGNIQFHIR